MSEPPSPFARLVLVIVCLSIAGSLVAGLHWYAVDRLSPNAAKVPTNEADVYCMNDCSDNFEWCSNSCGRLGVNPDFSACSNRCFDELQACQAGCGF